MSTFSRTSEKPQRTSTPLIALSWAGYAHTLTSLTNEARRVIKAGGLQDPAIIEHLRASRLATSNQINRLNE